MKAALVVFFVIVLGLTLMASIGCFLPRRHRLTRAAIFGRKPGELYTVVRDFKNHPQWRKGVRSVQLIPASADGCVRFSEVSSHGAITYFVVEDRSGEKLVTKIADEHLPFGGSWTIEFSVEPTGTRVSITEDGEVKNVFFRFMARFIFGYATTAEIYLRELGRKFDQDVSISDAH